MASNCGRCCKGVAVSSAFFKKHNPGIPYRRIGNQYRHEGTDVCVWLDKGRKCTIYTERPNACISFGCGKAAKHDAMKCPYFNPDGSEREAKETERLLGLCCSEADLNRIG